MPQVITVAGNGNLWGKGPQVKVRERGLRMDILVTMNNCSRGRVRMRYEEIGKGKIKKQQESGKKERKTNEAIVN